MPISRRETLALLGAAATMSCARQAHASPIVWNREPMQANAYAPLPLGAIKPAGWLRDELRIQADGLTGHLDEFWESVNPKTSGWRGGTGESWERGPYYLDGLVPLAYLLEDERLIAKAKEWVSWTLENQRPNGYIGPDQSKGTYARAWQAKDWWPNMVMLKVLTQYAEASGDPRVIPLMEKYLLYHLENAEKVPLVEWAGVRWAEEVLSIVYVYNRTGNERLLGLARILAKQAYDWRGHFANFQFPGKVTKQQAKLPTHVVNNAMALKTDAVFWQISGDASDRTSIQQILKVMDEHHLMPAGVHSGDEHYAGKSPVQGTELCAVVEAMFSYEVLLAILGDLRFADRLERIAYNALPATLSADHWTHQYDQQPNQVLCTRHPRQWTTNGPDSNLFGLEPNFGCCTANFHQGWPKFVTHMWMATRDKGLALLAYGPNVVEAPVGDGGTVRIRQETHYPFDGKVTLIVEQGGGRFPLHLRVPGWAKSIMIDGKPVQSTGEQRMTTLEREWKQGDRVEILFPMTVELSRWYNNAVAVERGPLVFALNVGTEWRKLRDAGMSADYELHPTTPWNYALKANPESQSPFPSVGQETSLPPKRPFSPEGAPVHIRLQAKRLPQWGMEQASAAPPPVSPVQGVGEEEQVELIPYGAAKLRITAFPWYTESS